jgi:hypothetical protein
MPADRVREGVYLTPIRLKIFDAIKRQPGITGIELSWIVYGNELPVSQGNVRAHIVHMRNDFFETNVGIHNRRHGYFIQIDRFQKRKTA